MAVHIAGRRAEEDINDDGSVAAAAEEERLAFDDIDDADATVEDPDLFVDDDDAAATEDAVEDAGTNRFFLGFKMLPLASRGKICRTSFSDASLDNSPDCL